MAFANKFRQLKTHYNINMPHNRCGIPRNALRDAAEILNKKDTEQWTYTSFHKGKNEIVAWQDGQTVFFMSDCYTVKQLGALKRSTKKARSVFYVQTPSAPWAFNVYGRSGCDSNDQGRKKFAMADRRCQREGTKGSLFLLDVTLGNCHIMKKSQSEDQSTVHKKKLTKFKFLDEYCTYVFDTYTVRKRMTGFMTAKNPHCPSSDELQAKWAAASEQQSHSLINIQWDKEKAANASGLHGNASALVKKDRSYGQCVVCKKRKREDGDNYDGRPLYTTLKCIKCTSGRSDSTGLWYHGDCFFPAHQCLVYAPEAGN
jgi:hypothetical protein